LKRVPRISKSAASKSARDETRVLYTEAIRQNIARKDWIRLSDVMMEAEAAGVGKTMRKKGWYHVGMYEAGKGNHPSAIIAFNSARFAQSKDKPVLKQLFSQIEAFYEANESVFSREDLLLLSEPIQVVEGFYRSQIGRDDANLDFARKLLSRIRAKMENAASKQETPVTHHVVRIHSALYTNLTSEEVRAEFARIIAPTLREMLKEEEAITKREKRPRRKKAKGKLKSVKKKKD
jgi:hypothetical protein